MHEAAALLRARKTSSRELTAACIANIERLDPELVAFISKTLDTAVVTAQRADDELARGIDRGPFHGIPVALKDLYDAYGDVTTAGSKILAANTAAEDSEVTARLRAGGAVLLGKTNLHEWAFGVTNQNPHFGAAKNPYDRSRIPGGSSGGSAIAVATGMCFVSPGSDTGGSIRIPAALCGIVGLKPTFGRISLRGVVPLSWSLDHAGPLARSVRDLALALQHLAGYDRGDVLSSQVDVGDYLSSLEAGVKGLRVIVPSTHFFDNVDPEVEGAVRDAARVFTTLGAQVSERALPRTAELAQTQRAILSVDAAAFHAERIAERPGDFGADVLQRLRGGQSITGVETARARRSQVEIRRDWSTIVGHDAVILTPTTPIAAPPRQGEDAVAAAARLTANTSPFNLTGLPAISIPCGFTRAGLPIGLQLAAGPWHEALLLRAARAFEAATSWSERHPK
ncbi:MAG TPA: amidase [Candidatus Limnocylindrales bacterium]|nr:amidase [Candidatus Limnocylindrales bacterium]